MEVGERLGEWKDRKECIVVIDWMRVIQDIQTSTGNQFGDLLNLSLLEINLKGSILNCPLN